MNCSFDSSFTVSSQDYNDNRYNPSRKNNLFHSSFLSLPMLNIILIINVLLLLLIKFTRHRVQNKTKLFKSETKHEVELTTSVHSIPPNQLKSVPVLFTVFFGIKLPVVLDSLLLLKRYKNEGLKFLERLVEKGGPIFYLPCFLKTIVMVNDPPLIQKILGSNDDRLINKPRFMYDEILTECFRRGLVSSEAEIWRPHRRLLNSCFSYKNNRKYLKLINKHSQTLVSNLNDECIKNGQAEGKSMRKSIYLNLFGIISEILLGESTFSSEETEKFQQHLKHWKALAFYKVMQPQNFIPFIWRINPKSKEYDYHIGEFRNHVITGVDRCREKLSSRTNQQDLKNNSDTKPEVESMPNHDDDGDDTNNNAQDYITATDSVLKTIIDAQATDIEIFDEIGTLLITGHETTDKAVHVFLQLIAESPLCQERCRKEVDKAFKRTEEKTPELTINDLSELEYLERCILETLRLATVVSFFSRELSSSMEINGIHFKKGTVFTFPVWATHRDPNLFPNPDQFDPDRFLAENVKGRHQYAYFPFSGGPRGCIGNKLAMIELKTILSWILHHFHIYTTDILTDMKFFHEGTAAPERSFNIFLKRRLQNIQAKVKLIN